MGRRRGNSKIIILTILQILKDRDKLTLTIEEKEQLKFLIALGTPPEYRSNLWKTCSGAKRDIEENKEYYFYLKKLSKEVPSLYDKQIRSDIKRTNPKMNSDPDFLEKLQNILTCYSIRNSSVGYCQGFNFIVSKLLEVILDEVYEILLLYRKTLFGYFVN